VNETSSRRAHFHPRQSFLTFGAPMIGAEEVAEVLDTLKSGQIGFGPKCLRFEADFARYLGRSHHEAVSVSSYSAALHLALVGADIGTGDEVITTPLTLPATVSAIELVGATPVFVDVDPGTHNLGPAAIEAAVTARTAAVILAHMAGRPCDMTMLVKIADRAGLEIIEDASHAIEARHRGRPVGSDSEFATFSFSANNTLTTAEGGMVVTNDHAAAERLRRLRQHGYSCSLTDLEASLGLHQLARLERSLAVRERHWRRYDEGLAANPWLDTPAPVPPGDRHARHRYTVRVRDDSPVSRDQLIDELHHRQIGTGTDLQPVHLRPHFQTRYGHRPGAFPVAEQLARSTLALPLSAGISSADVDYVVDAVNYVCATVAS